MWWSIHPTVRKETPDNPVRDPEPLSAEGRGNAFQSTSVASASICFHTCWSWSDCAKSATVITCSRRKLPADCRVFSNCSSLFKVGKLVDDHSAAENSGLRRYNSVPAGKLGRFKSGIWGRGLLIGRRLFAQ